jgi:hypothetical protein
MGRGELEGERVQRLERMRKRNYYTRGESLFKEGTPARAPRRRGKSRPTRTEAAQPMTRGGGLQVIQMVCGPPSAEKANRHEERTAARGSAPLHLRQKQWPSY